MFGYERDEPLFLRADERRFKQTLLSLLSNAVKFTAAEGRVTLEVVVAPGDDVEFHIVDTGIGMSDEEFAMALEPFEQAGGSVDRFKA